MWCEGGLLHKECPEKGQHNIDTDMLQLQGVGRRGTSSLQLLKLLARRRRDTKEKVAESAHAFRGMGVLFQSHHPRIILRSSTQQQPPSVAQACTATVGGMSAI
jgi:hypothetical protein